MGLFDSLFRKRRPAASTAPHGGFYPLHDAYGDGPDYDAWDARLDEVEQRYARQDALEERRRQRWWQRPYWQGRRKRWWAARTVAATLLLFFLLVGWLAVTAPLSRSLEPIAPPEITLLASDGTPIARNGAVVDKPVKVADLPPHVIEPLLAIEDRRFYSHWGVDPRGIARAVFTGVGGGSTITQQLAKFTFLTPERSLTRKAREALIAFWLEAWLTKDEILERYLSNAYFGDNTYGLRAASLHYFYRQPENLKPEQAAMLAGLLQAPSRYAPTRNFDRAKQRMGLVVTSMVAAGYLTEAEAKAMPVPRIDSRRRNTLPTGTYFADWALPEARGIADPGYASQTLTTTLDSRLQGIARRVTSNARLGQAQVALVAMRPNGEVVAMIGGKDYAKSPFNRATQAKRQPGSTFKLFVYLAALRSGMRPDHRVANTEITTGSYRPRNAGGTYSDSLTLQEAFAQSSNVAAVRLLDQIGSEAVIDTARDLGVSSPLAEGDPSLALGTSTMTLLELTAAYAGVAANDFPVQPHAFKQEEEGWFDWLWNGRTSLTSRQHGNIEDLLRSAVNRGTGRAAMLRGPNFGKTGTSQDYRDALFVGYAGDLVVGVWIGNDDNSPLNGITGGGLPARIWRDFMTQALGEVPVRRRQAPQPDPSGPVQPQDLPDLDALPPGPNGTRLRVEGNGVVISTDVDGLPVDVRIDEDGVGLVPADPPPER
ncbi:transglycosylase domain-containing protein [Altererythrobacter sp. H2]|uniref:transglycosylase domain-containing protein n=1 Tax=Altererythrobacter sp. H2 TaxID=3108391 RepID=UPI002B4BEC3A|nr:transglycosylase domain-containing protein [Altererythrobacter sp. H2]WRK97147.1 transglycosylase domain-containing protein [Altererythrobacter sp. H2]